MSDPRADEQLVESAKRGENAAFAALVERYQERVVRIAYSVVHDRDEAMDVAQEVFLRVYRKLDSFSGRARFFTWLYRIAKNMAIDRSRSRGRRRAESLDAVSEDTGQDGLDRLRDDRQRPMEDAADAELEMRIHAEIDRLPEKHREVVLLRDVEGLSYQEIADVVGCNLGTVMSRLHYARERLKQSLGPYLQEVERSS